MIILRDVPFERQARFLHDNVCGYPSNPAFDAALGEHDTDIASGLRACGDLLRALYADLSCIEAKDDVDRYQQLISTAAFLYAVSAFGTLDVAQDLYSVRIDKVLLKEHYRRGSLSKRVRHLAHHGLSVKLLSAQGEECGSLSRTSQLSLSTDRHPTLVPALTVFARGVASVPEGGQKSVYCGLGTFLKGDFESAILQRPVPREPLDPLRTDILDAVGAYRQDWTGLADRLRGGCGLACSGFWHYGASPAWSVSFAAKGKKPLAIFTLGSEIVFVEFTLPLQAAEQIIRDRARYSDTIRGKIESFHCVKCPKACQGANLTKVDGVWLCGGRAEARRIYATLATREDMASVHAMLDTICG